MAYGLLCALGLIACTKPPFEQFNDRPKLRTASNEVSLPTGSRWQRAHLDVEFKPGHVGFNSSWPPDASLVLVFGGASGAQRFTLRKESEGKYLNWDADEFRLAVDAHYELRAAPDGHALAFSRDGGTWSYIALDSGDRPFYCRHVQFAPPSYAYANFWTFAPTTKALALDIMGIGPPLAKTGHRPLNGFNTQELNEERDGVAGYFCSHMDDQDLQILAAQALVSPESNDWWRTDEIRECLQSAVKSNQLARAVLIQTVARRGDAQALAALYLSKTDDVTAQETLATTVATRLKDDAALEPDVAHPQASLPSRGCSELALMGWALAKITANSGGASQKSQEVLVWLARDESLERRCSEESAGHKARVFAVRGLAALRSGTAPKALRDLARSCSIQTWELPAELEWRDIDRREHESGDVSCWAQAALDFQKARSKLHSVQAPASRTCFPSGAAAVTSLRLPKALASGNGCLFFTDSRAVLGYEVTTGTLRSIAGKPDSSGVSDGLREEAQFFDPTGLARDGTRYLFVADSDRIRKVDVMSGKVTTLSLMPPEPPGLGRSFLSPESVVLDGLGHLYVLELQTLWRIDLDTGRMAKISGQFVHASSLV